MHDETAEGYESPTLQQVFAIRVVLPVLFIQYLNCIVEVLIIMAYLVMSKHGTIPIDGKHLALPFLYVHQLLESPPIMAEPNFLTSDIVLPHIIERDNLRIECIQMIDVIPFHIDSIAFEQAEYIILPKPILLNLTVVMVGEPNLKFLHISIN